MRRSGRLATVSAIAVAALVTLTGCDQFLADPVVFTRVDETTVVRICLDLTITEIEIEAGDGDARAPDILWSASGSATISAGTEFAFSALPDGLASQTAFDESVVDTDDVVVRMSVSHVKGGAWTTFTWLDAGSLAEGRWLDGAGTPTTAPCAQQPCRPGWACHNDWPDPTGRPTEPRPTFSPAP